MDVGRRQLGRIVTAEGATLPKDVTRGVCPNCGVPIRPGMDCHIGRVVKRTRAGAGAKPTSKCRAAQEAFTCKVCAQRQSTPFATKMQPKPRREAAPWHGRRGPTTGATSGGGDPTTTTAAPAATAHVDSGSAQGVPTSLPEPPTKRRHVGGDVVDGGDGAGGATAASTAPADGAASGRTLLNPHAGDRPSLPLFGGVGGGSAAGGGGGAGSLFALRTAMMGGGGLKPSRVSRASVGVVIGASSAAAGAAGAAAAAGVGVGGGASAVARSGGGGLQSSVGHSSSKSVPGAGVVKGTAVNSVGRGAAPGVVKGGGGGGGGAGGSRAAPSASSSSTAAAAASDAKKLSRKQKQKLGLLQFVM